MFPFTISSSLFSLLGLLSLLLSSLAGADTLYQICDGVTNYTVNSTYQSNLKLLLSTLASNGSASGFLKDTVGQIPDQVYGLVLCRGDVNATECSSCLDTATQDVQQICPYDRGAVVWYDFCVVRFSNQQFLSSYDNSKQEGMYNVNNITRVDRFNKLLDRLLNSTADWAANSTKKFSTGEVRNFTSEFPTIYSLMQCTRDLSQSDCRQCLQNLFIPLPSYMFGKQGARVIGVRCSMRYEVYSFFEGAPTLKLTAPVESTVEPAPAPAPPLATPASGREGNIPAGGKEARKENETGTVLAIAIPAVTAILLVSIICISYCRMRKPIIKLPPNFSEENKLGEGGFGEVYRHGSSHPHSEEEISEIQRKMLRLEEEMQTQRLVIAELQSQKQDMDQLQATMRANIQREVTQRVHTMLVELDLTLSLPPSLLSLDL